MPILPSSRKTMVPSRQTGSGKETGRPAGGFWPSAWSSAVWWSFPLLALFNSDPEVIQIGIGYLRIEGSFYALIGFLFMFYGYFRAIDEPMISVVLTIFSLGTRVLLAYLLSAVLSIGYIGICASIPIGWALADLAGLYYLHKKAVKPADCF